MYSIVIQPSFEIGFELLMVDEYKKEIVRIGTTSEYNIIDLLKSIIKTIEEREKKND